MKKYIKLFIHKNKLAFIFKYIDKYRILYNNCKNNIILV